MTVSRELIFAFISFLVSFLLFPVVIKVFKRLDWYDQPGTHKIHKATTPSMGGIPVLVGSLLGLLMSLPLLQWIGMKYFFISVLLMFLIGVRDDVLALSPRQKLVSQFLPVFVLVFLGEARLLSFYEITGAAPWPPLLSYAISLFTVIIICNAYNLIDGIDGLAGTIGALALTFFGVWFYIAGNTHLSLIAFCFAGSLIAFLIFNWQPSSIFMGDTGALTIGLILSFLAIRFINHNAGLPSDHLAKFGASISTAICVLIIPIFDTLRVIILRLKQFQSPFHADKNHIHHQFLGMGMSHAGAVRWIAAINLGFIIIALALKNANDLVIFPIIALICVLITFVFKWKKGKTPDTMNHA